MRSALRVEHAPSGRGSRLARAAATLALLVAAALPAGAVELEGLEAPEHLTRGERELRLNGIGIRTATAFRVKIYVAALYLETPSPSADEILASSGLKLITQRYLYAIDRKDMRRGWTYSFEQNCPEAGCASQQEAIDRFQSLVHAVEPGDRYEYRFFDDRVEIVRDGTLEGSITHPGFSAFLLSTWIGREPPTEALKQSLLGRNP